MHSGTRSDLAYRHPITGVANRRALEQRVADELGSDRPFAVAFVDLDHFKRINDCLGYTTGDIVLAAATARMSPLVPARSLLAHFAGDVFSLVLVDMETDRAVDLVWKLLARFADPLYVAGHELRLSASAGVAIRDPASTVDWILSDADAALTRAKAVRRGGVEVFTEAMRSDALDRLVMENEFRRALRQDKLELHLQPVVRLATGEVDGHEGLARWTRPNGERVPPERFISMAEDGGLIAEVGDWVLGRVVRLLAKGVTRRISVNLSPRELLDPSLPGRVERLLAHTSISGTQLCFEITETVVVENFEVARASLHALRRLGCFVGLDDFGTGYSSLGYLRKLPIDFVKLDRALTADIDTDPQAALVCESVVSLLHALSLIVVAEGIERQGQLAAVTSMGCAFGQGWILGHPKPADS